MDGRLPPEPTARPRYVVLIRGSRTVFAIPLDESGALRAVADLQPPPWQWRLRPGDRIEFR
jgi:hypothetical protein